MPRRPTATTARQRSVEAELEAARLFSQQGDGANAAKSHNNAAARLLDGGSTRAARHVPVSTRILG